MRHTEVAAHSGSHSSEHLPDLVPGLGCGLHRFAQFAGTAFEALDLAVDLGAPGFGAFLVVGGTAVRLAGGQDSALGRSGVCRGFRRADRSAGGRCGVRRIRRPAQPGLRVARLPLACGDEPIARPRRRTLSRRSVQPDHGDETTACRVVPATTSTVRSPAAGV